jgi:hypothetical protein
MGVRIQLRRDTAANWISTNPILANGETGIETDTRKFKFGNGISRWNQLAYAVGDGADSFWEETAESNLDMNDFAVVSTTGDLVFQAKAGNGRIIFKRAPS